MKDHTLTSHYAALTPEERVHAMVAAWNRGDAEEMHRLWAHSPMLVFRGREPRVRDQWRTLILLAYQAYSRLTELSWLVMQVRHHLDQKAPRAETRRKRVAVVLLTTPCLSGAASCTGEAKIEGQDVEDREELPINRATLRYLSARWRAVNEAVERFCDEIGLSRDRFFALVLDRARFSRSVVEQVPPLLDSRALADPNQVERIHRAMQTIWRQTVDPQ
jgi:hypothetical protein